MDRHCSLVFPVLEAREIPTHLGNTSHISNTQLAKLAIIS